MMLKQRNKKEELLKKRTCLPKFHSPAWHHFWNQSSRENRSIKENLKEKRRDIKQQ